MQKKKIRERNVINSKDRESKPFTFKIHKKSSDSYQEMLVNPIGE